MESSAPIFAPAPPPLTHSTSRANYTNNTSTNPNHRSNQIVSSNGMTASIILAEPLIYLQGFTRVEFGEEAPAILRGSLVVKCTKPTKIKALTLTFKGVAKTEWPEGIPPKKSEHHETKEIHSHVWPFFNASFPMAEFSSGAHVVRLDNNAVISEGREVGHRRSVESLNGHDSDSDSANEGFSAVRSVRRGLANTFRRAASPNPTGTRSRSPSAAMLFPTELSLGPHRSFSKQETQDHDIQQKGFRVFQPGEYSYNFELPIPQSLPESIECAYGSVKYTLEAVVERPGAFRSNLTGRKDVKFIRNISFNNLEASEPISISRSWEDQLHYEIVVGGKMFTIGGHIPIAFKLTPLAKVKCHRIRIYVTENAEYYAHNRKVHRIEPTKKYLLKEQLPETGLNGDLLEEFYNSNSMAYSGEELPGSTELEFQVLLPTSFESANPHYRLHANTTHGDIKVHHWIKIILRLSKPNLDIQAENVKEQKRKFFEISIDSPISLLDTHCTNANTSLPQYVNRRPSFLSRSPSVMGIPTNSYEDRLSRPIHLLRRPSIAPPTFEESQAPNGIPLVSPPKYEAVVKEKQKERMNMNSMDSPFASDDEIDDDRSMPGSSNNNRQNSTTMFHRRSIVQSGPSVSSITRSIHSNSTSSSHETSSFELQRQQSVVSTTESVDLADQMSSVALEPDISLRRHSHVRGVAPGSRVSGAQVQLQDDDGVASSIYNERAAVNQVVDEGFTGRDFLAAPSTFDDMGSDITDIEDNNNDDDDDDDDDNVASRSSTNSSSDTTMTSTGNSSVSESSATIPTLLRPPSDNRRKSASDELDLRRRSIAGGDQILGLPIRNVQSKRRSLYGLDSETKRRSILALLTDSINHTEEPESGGLRRNSNSSSVYSDHSSINGGVAISRLNTNSTDMYPLLNKDDPAADQLSSSTSSVWIN